ncbi:hypothetical protein OG884_07775 [Streptosporangium sp. NBC_01755]|uniref:hypothetical protein n=1 Tax=Streptosporangium sp. NBC_01755 TaxID=2975949 RepID=UPI002DD7A53F|nr:hypothetical protein [Streptosporangium sp. NBC_01755]WSD01809.1 hypothetical protein OG884_07775 [Streptosporangium sp. NBC_01755]
MSIRPDSTMFAALHGELVSHPWRDPHVASSDAYSLFVARSSAMGWLTEATENASGGLWGMNDAGQGPDSGSDPSRIAWFQVSLTEPVPDGRPLPVQAFLSCAGDVVARIGTPRLRAVQLLLPVQSLDASSRVRGVIPLLQEAGWFADVDPRLRTPVRVTLDGGQEPSIRSAAPEMLRWMRGFTQDVFSCDSFSLTDDDTVLKPAVIDELWRGPARHRATFSGVLAEWSLDALGWLAAFLAEASSQNGVGTPLMLTADRPEGSRSHVD